MACSIGDLLYLLFLYGTCVAYLLFAYCSVFGISISGSISCFLLIEFLNYQKIELVSEEVAMFMFCITNYDLYLLARTEKFIC